MVKAAKSPNQSIVSEERRGEQNQCILVAGIQSPKFYYVSSQIGAWLVTVQKFWEENFELSGKSKNKKFLSQS
jgi:hypothetical protein